jgi:carboxypeptidase PM20D1
MLQFPSRQATHPLTPRAGIDESQAVSRLAEALRFRTVSEANPARTQRSEFERMRRWLKEAFPRVHARLKRTTGVELGDSENLSLVYTWQGQQPDAPAWLMMGHYDVVPAEDPKTPGAAGEWKHPPFDGVVDAEYIWGRGALDCKNAAMGWLEAIEYLLGQDFQPKRTIYLSLGHDEEVGGTRGNKQVAEWMRRQGIHLELVLDEGGCIIGDFPGIDRPVALVGIAEKGWATVRLHVRLPADQIGHAAMPARESAIGVLARGLDRLQSSTPFPLRLNGGVDRTLDYIGPEMSLLPRMAIANRWLFAKPVARLLSGTDSGRAMLQTTLVPTMIDGGIKDNVLPSEATAVLNMRLLPGDRIETSLEKIRLTLDDPRIEVGLVTTGPEASRFSSDQSPAFQTLHRTVKEIYGDVVVAPFVLTGGTDASHFDDGQLARDVYRFLPNHVRQIELKRIHGVDERISRQNYLDLIQFYIRLIDNLNNRP